MKKIRLFWQIYPSLLMTTLIALFAVSWYTSRSVHQFFLDQTKVELHTQAMLLKNQIAPFLQPLDAAAVDRLCKGTGGPVETRITVILADGLVVGDSKESPSKMDNHGKRPEVLYALGGGIGTSVRQSGTLRQRMMYVAVPLYHNGKVHAVVRTSLFITALDHEIGRIQFKIGISGFVIALMISVICLYLSRRLSRPLEQIKQGAERFAGGDLGHRLALPWTAEIAALAQAMNQMAGQLENRIEAIITQRNEYEAVLASMVEGVVALDPEDRILSMNRSAIKILGVKIKGFKNHTIQEVVRSRDLNAFLSGSMPGDEATEADIVIRQDTETILNAHAIPLCDAEGNRIGRLIVLNDVTQIRLLENVRRDFVANVSHEIKTPLTAIKGFVETLMDNYDADAEQTDKFLNIIKKHVDRLDAIVDDLLALARLERRDELESGRFEPRPIKEIIETAVQVVQPKADQKQISFDLKCQTDLNANVDATLIEQALVNLIDNAVKYSPEKSRVTISVEQTPQEVAVHVRDNGPGIPKVHQPRLFERFYRVDKARSRNLGGTGLGLAIVKHIVQAHHGRVTVDSRTGRGSTFSIHLPAGVIV